MAGNPSLDEIAAIFEETRRPRVSLIRPGLIHVEQALNIFVEPSLQAFAAGQHWLLDGASWMYVNSQTSITLGA